MESILQWFSEPGIAGFANWVTTVVGVIIALLTLPPLYAGHRREKRRDKAQEAASQRAVLRARLVKEGNKFNIMIQNEGEACAYEVQATMDGHPILEHPVMPRGQTEIRKIGPHSHVNYTAAVRFGCAPPFDLSLKWKDNSGQEEQYETTLQ